MDNDVSQKNISQNNISEFLTSSLIDSLVQTPSEMELEAMHAIKQGINTSGLIAKHLFSDPNGGRSIRDTQKYLARLEQKKLVRKTKSGRLNIWSLNPEGEKSMELVNKFGAKMRSVKVIDC